MKKYQVFISSTYKDLKKARLKVRDAILSLYQFPVGMEMFGAASEDQWSVIKRDIDESDCYVLIIGKTFGSMVPNEGISFTQKEFRYAKDCGIPIYAFIISENAKVPKTFQETDPKRQELLRSFVSEVCDHRMVDYWKNEDELATKVTSALARFFGGNPRGGWQKVTENGGNSSSDIERHDSTYITIKGDENKTKYCSRCYDVDSKKVQLECYQGAFKCPQCNNTGIYDHDQYIAFSRQLNSQSHRKTVSSGLK